MYLILRFIILYIYVSPILGLIALVDNCCIYTLFVAMLRYKLYVQSRVDGPPSVYASFLFYILVRLNDNSAEAIFSV